mmetsp:Transcript_23661/g.37997  ORF Transcript_23661/g.37997 Transcript_23661/m.37997 type:complete len:102 (-) Transcript_23661:88-393(-)
MAYITSFPTLACFWNTALMMVETVKQRSSEEMEVVLSGVEHWVEKLTGKIESRPNPHCGRVKCRIGDSHSHEDHAGCSHVHKTTEKGNESHSHCNHGGAES